MYCGVCGKREERDVRLAISLGIVTVGSVCVLYVCEMRDRC